MNGKLNLPPSVVYYADSDVLDQRLKECEIKDLTFFYRRETDENVSMVILDELIGRCQELGIEDLLFVIRDVLSEGIRYRETGKISEQSRKLEVELEQRLPELDYSKLLNLFWREDNSIIYHQLTLEFSNRVKEVVKKGNFKLHF